MVDDEPKTDQPRKAPDACSSIEERRSTGRIVGRADQPVCRRSLRAARRRIRPGRSDVRRGGKTVGRTAAL